MKTAKWFADLFKIVRECKEFNVWRADPDQYESELNALFSPFGIVWHQWPAVVSEYQRLEAKGKEAADFALAYGFPPDYTEETLLALSIAQPYAAQKRWHQLMRAVGVGVGRFTPTIEEVGEAAFLASALRSMMNE